MMRRALRIAGGIAVAVAATALTHAALPAHASNPGTCGIDDAPACPVVTQTAPSIIDWTLNADVRMTMIGSSLASVATVELLPGGQAVGIAERSDNQLVVIVPRGAISPGNTYHLQLALGGQTSNMTQTAPIAVAAAGAPAAAAASLVPAPTVAPTPRPTARPAAVPASTSSESGFTGLTLLWLFGGFIVAALACTVFARRTGLLDELRGPVVPPAEVLQPVTPRYSFGPPASMPALEFALAAPAVSPAHAAAALPHPSWQLVPVAAAANVDPGPVQRSAPTWSIREQTKPTGAVMQVRIPPH